MSAARTPPAPAIPQRRRAVFNLLPNVAIGDATTFIENAFAQVRQQYPGVQATFQGEALVFRQLFRALPLLLISAIFVMYVILGILYESYVHPITVLFPAIVPAVVGGLFTLWLFGSTLSLYSVIGLFLLLGIVKKNGIMVVDFALQRIDEGWDLRSAIHEASMERFRPIMMTSSAASSFPRWSLSSLPRSFISGSSGSRNTCSIECHSCAAPTLITRAISPRLQGPRNLRQ